MNKIYAKIFNNCIPMSGMIPMHIIHFECVLSWYRITESGQT